MNAGIDWVRDTEPAAWKLTVGLDAIRWAKTHDDSLRGYFTDANMRRLRENIGDRFEGSETRWSAAYVGVDRDKGFGHALVHRARHCLPKELGGTFNEIERFKDPALAPFYELVSSRFEDGSSIDIFDLWQAQERVVLLQSTKLPGVYIKASPLDPSMVDVGFSGDIAKNNKGDSPRGMFTVKAYFTTSREAAKGLETDIHSSMEATGLRTYRRGDLFRFRPDVDAVELVESLLLKHHRSRLRGSARFAPAKHLVLA